MNEKNPYLDLLLLFREWNQDWEAYDIGHLKLKPKDALKLIEDLKNKFDIKYKNE